MITILGTQITVFALYGLVSLQLLAIALPIIAYRIRNVKDDDGFPTPTILCFMFGGFCEAVTIAWVACI